MTNDPLVSAETILNGAPRSHAVIDATWYLGAEKGWDTYRSGHLPGAHFFDIDEIADTTAGLPHMMPAPDRFAACVGPMIGDGRRPIVIYDATPLRAAARVWWTFGVMGLGNARVLDGGSAAWITAGGTLTTEIPAAEEGTPHLAPRHDLVIGFDAMLEAVEEEDVLVLDARSGGRFAGTEPEPRPGLSSGAMPGGEEAQHEEAGVSAEERGVTGGGGAASGRGPEGA